MVSPTKKRKKNPPTTPHKGKTLDYFFGKDGAQSPMPAGSRRTGQGSSSAQVEGLTDEEHARRLVKQWEEEDRTATGMGDATARAGVKRRRSSSAVREDGELTRKLAAEEDQKGKVDHTESSTFGWNKATRSGDREEQTPDRTGPINSAYPEPVTPKKKEVSVRAEEDIIRTTESIPLDSDPREFTPDNYQNLAHSWPDGKATYGLLTRAFVLVNSTRSRIKVVDTLVNLLRTLIRLDPESLLAAVWLTTNDIGPPYEHNELGIGSSIITKAITGTSGITPATLKKLWHKYGDPGDVAFDAKAKQRTLMMRKPTPLTINNVYGTLLKIAAVSGKGSQNVKEGLVKRLLVDAKGEEIRYLTRTFIQHLRIGAVKTTMLVALARAFTFSRPNDATWECPGIPAGKEARQELFARGEEVLKQCFARRPNYNDLVPALLRSGVDALEKECGMEIHIPLKPMLGSITRGLEEMLVKLQGRDFACEYKYDGQRAQIHCDDAGNVSIFSRHLELMTSKYPDLVELVPKIRMRDVESFVLEGEVVAVNTTTGELRPFQSLAGRERKNVDIADISITVCLFAFDLMYINGQQLLSQPFRERRHLLRTKFHEIPNRFTWVTSLDATSARSAVVREFFKSALTAKCEGIMVKILDNTPAPAHLTADEGKLSTSKQKPKSSRRKPLLSTYEPDKRLESWLKVKKDYSSMADTLDLIPIGGWHGQGRKSAWWSPVLLAVRNPNTGSLEAVCKCMSGFTDKFYAEMKTFYGEDGENTSKIKKGYYESALNPAVWFEAKEVWEVAFADITLSPTYSAALGLVSDERGLSLRFPRFLRKREDKGMEEASTNEFLADLYRKQEQGGGASHVPHVEPGEEMELELEIEEEEDKHIDDGVEQAEDGNQSTTEDDMANE